MQEDKITTDYCSVPGDAQEMHRRRRRCTGNPGDIQEMQEMHRRRRRCAGDAGDVQETQKMHRRRRSCTGDAGDVVLCEGVGCIHVHDWLRGSVSFIIHVAVPQ